jgi:trehalose 6-phosphate phosphatase
VDAVTRLSATPSESAIFLDMDGVLAPIVERPDDAAVPEETRTELRRLVARYALVAVVTGRDGADARGRVGVDGIVYVGSHGLELNPAAASWARRIHDFASSVAWPVESKHLTVSFHFRDAEDERAAVAMLDQVADRAREEGFTARYGRKVLEILPPVSADKGTAVRHLLEERDLRRALYAGDDTTDLDGFHALDGLELAVRVAVASDEGPQALREAADVVVGSPAQLLELLRRL